MPSALIVVLNYSGEMLPEVDAALNRSVDMLRAKGWGVEIKRRVADSILVRARNVSLAEFLGTRHTHLFCLDDDVSWDGDEMVRLLEAPVDFCAGIYPAKMETPTYFVHYTDRERIERDPDTGLVEFNGVPAGFMRLTRRAVEKMATAYAHLQFDDPMVPGGHAWLLFNFELHANRLWGEDYIFCRKWKAIGGRIWVEPQITLHHHAKPDAETGKRKVYTGNFGDWLLSRPDMKEAA